MTVVQTTSRLISFRRGALTVRSLATLALALALLALALAVWALVRPDQSADSGADAALTPRVDQSAPADRSAIAQPGEDLAAGPLAPQRLAPAPTFRSPLSPPTDAVSWDRAGRYVGHPITAQGRVVQAKNIGEVCFLNFNDDPAGGQAFYIVIFKEAFAGIPGSPEDYYRDKLIRVTGEVKLHRNRPQIQVRDAAQIIVVDE